MGATGSTWCGRSQGRAAAVLALVVVLLVACTAGGDDANSGADSSAVATLPAAFASVDATDDAVRIHTGDVDLTITLAPFGLVAAGASPFLATGPSGLFVVAVDGGRDTVVRAKVLEADTERVVLDLETATGPAGTLTLTGGGRTVAFDLAWASQGAGPTAWGLGTALAEDEAVYGLTERIVDSLLDSEIEPKEVGSLDRRGETVSMWVTPTMSGYAPFHQTSAGYGLLVEGTMPGSYDVGVADPDELTLEFELPPGGGQAGFVLFHGPRSRGDPRRLHRSHRPAGRPADGRAGPLARS